MIQCSSSRRAQIRRSPVIWASRAAASSPYHTQHELAVTFDHTFFTANTSAGTLARLPLSGGAPRELAEGVISADWSPDGNSLAVVRFAAGKVRLEYPLGKVLYETEGWISDARVSPDGERVAFIDHPISV